MEPGVAPTLNSYSTLERKKMKAPAPPPPKAIQNEKELVSGKQEITLSEHHAIVYTYDEKNWKPVSDKYISLIFTDSGGQEVNERDWLRAFFEEKKVLQYNITLSTKVKIKDSFVRCQNDKMIVGARFKKVEAAQKYQQQLTEIVAEITPYAKVNKNKTTADPKNSPVLLHVTHKRNESISSASSQEHKDSAMLSDLDNSIWKPFLTLANLQNEELANIQISTIVKNFVLERGGDRFLHRVNDQKLSPKLVDDLNDLAGQVHEIINPPAQITPTQITSQSSVPVDDVDSSPSKLDQPYTKNGADSFSTLDRKAMKNKRRAPPPPLRKAKSLQNLLNDETVYCEIAEFQDGGIEVRSNSVNSRSVASPPGKRKAPAAPAERQSANQSQARSPASPIASNVPSGDSTPVSPSHDTKNVDVKSDELSATNEKPLPLFVPPPPPDEPPPTENIGSPVGPLSPETGAQSRKDGETPLKTKVNNDDECISADIIDERHALAELDKAISSEELNMDSALNTPTSSPKKKYPIENNVVVPKKKLSLQSSVEGNSKTNGAPVQNVKEQEVEKKNEAEGTVVLNGNLTQESNVGVVASNAQAEDSLQKQLLALQEQVMQQQQMLQAAGLLVQKDDVVGKQQNSDSRPNGEGTDLSDTPSKNAGNAQPTKAVEKSPEMSFASSKTEETAQLKLNVETPEKSVEKESDPLINVATTTSNGDSLRKSSAAELGNEKPVDLNAAVGNSRHDDLSKNVVDPTEKIELDTSSTMTASKANLLTQSNLDSSNSEPCDTVSPQTHPNLESHNNTSAIPCTVTETQTITISSNKTKVADHDSSAIVSSTPEEKSISTQQSNASLSTAETATKPSSPVSGVSKKPTSGLYAKLKAKTAAKSKTPMKSSEPDKTEKDSPAAIIKQYNLATSSDLHRKSLLADRETGVAQSEKIPVNSSATEVMHKKDLTVNTNASSEKSVPLIGTASNHVSNDFQKKDNRVTTIPINPLSTACKTENQVDVKSRLVSVKVEVVKEKQAYNSSGTAKVPSPSTITETKDKKHGEPIIEQQTRILMRTSIADNSVVSTITTKEETKGIDSMRSNILPSDPKSINVLSNADQPVKMSPSVTNKSAKPSVDAESPREQMIRNIQNSGTPNLKHSIDNSDQAGRNTRTNDTNIISTQNACSKESNSAENGPSSSVHNKPPVKPKPKPKPKPSTSSNTNQSKPATFMRSISEEPGSRKTTTTKTVGALTFGFARDTTRSFGSSINSHIVKKEPPKTLPKTTRLSREYSIEANSSPSTAERVIEGHNDKSASVDIDFRSREALVENP